MNSANDNGGEQLGLALVCFAANRGTPDVDVLWTRDEQVARVLRDTKRALGWKVFVLDAVRKAG